MASGQLGVALRHVHRLFSEGTLAGLSDAQLLARFVSRRDEAAFAALVARHGPMVLGVCRAVLRDPHAAEDAFQAAFLVLVRKAGSLWVEGSLGGWLYRVAYRIALQANADAARRWHEGQEGLMSVAEPLRSGPWDHIRPVLHEEIDRLPQKYRAPIVLCYFEKMTYDEAALELRWTAGTVRGRLVKARALLRTRLTRRGVALSGGLLSSALAEQAKAAVPAAWIDSTVRAALVVAVGRVATAGAVSATAVALTEGMLKAMALARLKAITTLMLAIVAITGVALGTFPAVAVEKADKEAERTALASRPKPTPVAEPQAAPTSGATKDEPSETIEIRGCVLDPDGRPAAGVRIHFFDPHLPEEDAAFRDGPPVANAISDADGHFRFRVPDPGPRLSLPVWFRPVVAALADGFGPGWVSMSADGARDLTLRLVKDDVPIVGRVLDLEGRPIAGVTVSPITVFASADEDLSGWLKAVAGAKDYRGVGESLPRILHVLGRRSRSVITDVDGRFRLTGIGRERLVSLQIEGPTIVTSAGSVHARTRPGPTFQVTQERHHPDYGTLIFHGTAFDYIAAPTRPIVGVVRDKDTGKPVAGVSIRSHRFSGSVVHGTDFVRTTTDTQGRFRLVGMPGGPGNLITATPATGQPYLGSTAEVPAGEGTDPAVVDLALKRGVAIRGRVVDKATGRPVRAEVRYLVFVDNPHIGEAKNLHGAGRRNRQDGSFEVTGLPGRGLIAVRADEDRYLVGQGADTIRGAQENGWFPTEPEICIPQHYHAIVEMNPAVGDESATCAVALDPGLTLPGIVLGPDDQPLPGASAANLKPKTMSPNFARLPSAEFAAVALDPKRSRPLFFRHDEKNLSAMFLAKGDEPGPLTVRLQPAASITGRLLDSDGNPRTGIDVNLRFTEGQFGFPAFLRPTVDDRGRFRVEGLIPGMTYDVDVIEGFKLTGKIARGLALRPGECRDLGDVRTEEGPRTP